MKKNVLLKNYKLSSKFFEDNIEVKDHFSALYNVIHGKIKIFDRPIIMHQTHFNSEGNKRYNVIKKNFLNTNFIKDLILLDDILCKKLKCRKYYILEKYYKNVSNVIFQNFEPKKEPSSKELYGFFINKLKRRIIKNNKRVQSSKKFSYNKSIKKIVNDIEFFLENNY